MPTAGPATGMRAPRRTACFPVFQWAGSASVSNIGGPSPKLSTVGSLLILAASWCLQRPNKAKRQKPMNTRSSRHPLRSSPSSRTVTCLTAIAGVAGFVFFVAKDVHTAPRMRLDSDISVMGKPSSVDASARASSRLLALEAGFLCSLRSHTYA